MPQELNRITLTGSVLALATALALLPASARAQTSGGFLVDAPELAQPRPSVAAPAAVPGPAAPAAGAKSAAGPVPGAGAANAAAGNGAILGAGEAGARKTGASKTGPGKPGAGKTALPKIEPLPSDGDGPDESALRYYASLNQTERVETEIKRLKKLYPEWKPPADLYETRKAGGVDEQPFWDLFSLGRLDELQREIARRQREEPGWQPSEDLRRKIRKKLVRNKIMALWKANKWKELVAFVKKEGYGGDDTDIDVLWTIAAASAKTKQIDDAMRIYKSILNTNKNPEHRRATIQKAMAALRMRDVEKLIALVKSRPGGAQELEPIAIDITSSRIGAFLHDEREEPVPEEEVAKFEEFARKSADPDHAGLIAWYRYKNKTYQPALEWFKFALSRGGDAMIAHGLAHSLRELGMYRETEEVAYAWREPLVNNLVLFVDILERDLTKEIPPYIEPRRLQRYAQVTMDSAAGEGAQALAWYAYNTCQFKVAHEWFKRAVAWQPKEATVYGYALVLRKLKKSKEFWEVLNRYDGLFPKVIEIIYPDDYIHPPNPCELLRKKGWRPGKKIDAGKFTVPGSYLAPQAGQQVQAAAPGQVRPVWQTGNNYYQKLTQGQGSPVTLPDGRRRRTNAKEPKISRKLFPVAVNPENPLRFFPVGRMTGEPAEAASQRPPVRVQLIAEPPRIMAQLVARRVPGVGRMPYERWGYTLLPGYNGKLKASEPHSAEYAPADTLWATLYADEAKSTRGSRFDKRNLLGNIAASLRAIANAPRVPEPKDSRTGPWRSMTPYKSQEQKEAEKLGIEPEGEGDEGEGAPASAKTSGKPSAKSGKPAKSGKSAKAPSMQHRRVSAPPAHKLQTRARDPLAIKATSFYNAGKYGEALAALEQRAARLKETTGLKLLRAWSLLKLGRTDESRKIFGSLGGAGPKPNLAQRR